MRYIVTLGKTIVYLLLIFTKLCGGVLEAGSPCVRVNLSTASIKTVLNTFIQP